MITAMMRYCHRTAYGKRPAYYGHRSGSQSLLASTTFSETFSKSDDTHHRCYNTNIIHSKSLLHASLSQKALEDDIVQDLLRQTATRGPLATQAANKAWKILLEDIFNSDSPLPVADRLSLLNHVLNFQKTALEQQRPNNKRRRDNNQPLIDTADVAYAWPREVLPQVQAWLQQRYIRGELIDDFKTQATYVLIFTALSRTQLNQLQGPEFNRDVSMVRDILNTMPLEPSAVAWNAALTVMAKWQAPSAAWDLFQTMKQQTTVHINSSHAAKAAVPDLVSYSCVLESLVHETSPYEFPVIKAQGLLQEMMKTKHAQPNSTCYFHYLRILIAHQQLDVALETLRQLAREYVQAHDTATTPTAVVPDQCMFAVVLAAYARQGDHKRVHELLLLLKSLHQTMPTADDFLLQPRSLTNVLKALAAGGGDKKALAQTMDRILQQCRHLALKGKKPSCLPNTLHYNMVLEAWSKISSDEKRAVDRAGELFDQMSCQRSSQPNTLSCTTLQKAWMRSRHPDKGKRCQAILNDMWKMHEADPSANIRPDLYAYNIAILALARSAKLDPSAAVRADALFQDLKERFDDGDASLEPDEASYVAVMTAWSQSIAKALPHRKSYAVEKCRLYMKAARKHHRAESRMSMLSTKIYTAMLDALKEIGAGQEADVVFEQMLADHKAGIISTLPTVATLNTLMSAWARSRADYAPLRAQALLDSMQQLYEEEGLDLKPDVRTYNVLLDCWAKSGREDAPERAEEIVALLEGGQHGFRPDNRMYAAVLEAWAKSRADNAPQRALDLLKQLESRCLSGENACCPTMFHYAIVINAFAERGDHPGVVALIARMEHAGIKPDAYCYNGCIKAIIRSKASDAGRQAVKVLRLMQKSGSACSRPDVVTYTSCISAFELDPTLDAVNRAQALLEECIAQVSNKVIAPTPSTFLAFLRVVRQSDTKDKFERVEYTRDRMRRLGIAPSRGILLEMELLCPT
jgi:pentatricopeptide repeat protein